MTTSRLYPDRPYLASSVAVLRNGTVLLVARGRPPLQGVFSLPGGLVEPGETLAEAALRELREEVGVEAEMIGFIGPVEIIERDEAGLTRRHFVVCAHAARWLTGEPVLGPEAQAVRWVLPDEVDALPTTPGLPAIVAGAFALDGPLTSS